MKRLHLVDGTFELFRAHFSKRPGHTTPAGMGAKATVGVVSSLLALLHDPNEAVTHLGVAFDHPIRSFRNELFEGYKSDEGVPETLRAQFEGVEQAVRALGVVVWSMNHWEADDALATAVKRFGGSFDQVRILSPDKDLGQCLAGPHSPSLPDHVVQVDRIRKREINAAVLRTTHGVDPESVPDWLALTGDPADGIPGVPGIGDKTAAALLGHYRHLETIPHDAAHWQVSVRGATRVAEALATFRDKVLLYRTLATLVTDVPLPEQDAEVLRFAGVPREAFTRWCDQMGATSLKARPTRWA